MCQCCDHHERRTLLRAMVRDTEAILSALLELSSQLESRQTPERLGSKSEDTKPTL